MYHSRNVLYFVPGVPVHIRVPQHLSSINDKCGMLKITSCTHVVRVCTVTTTTTFSYYIVHVVNIIHDHPIFIQCHMPCHPEPPIQIEALPFLYSSRHLFDIKMTRSAVPFSAVLDWVIVQFLWFQFQPWMMLLGHQHRSLRSLPKVHQQPPRKHLK